MDQLRRSEGLTAEQADELTRALDRAEAQLKTNEGDSGLANELTTLSQSLDHKGLSKAVSDIAARVR